MCDSSAVVHPFARQCVASFLDTWLCLPIRSQCVAGQPCKTWDKDSTLLHPARHRRLSGGLDIMPAVGRLAVRSCTARTKSRPVYPCGFCSSHARLAWSSTAALRPDVKGPFLMASAHFIVCGCSPAKFCILVISLWICSDWITNCRQLSLSCSSNLSNLPR